jgi:hypothetical protein
VGWFPLGPREVYVPAYRVSQTYVRNVNVTNTTIVNNTYITNVYEHNPTPVRYLNNTPRTVTAVPRDVFTSGQRVGGHAVHLQTDILAGAPVSAEAPAIAPIRQSVLGPSLGRGAVRPPATLLNRAVVARTAPPRGPAPLERQLAAIQANGGRALTREEIARLQPATPAAPVHVLAAGTVLAAPAHAANHPAGLAAAQRPPAVPASAAPNFAERERVLQRTRVTGTPRSNSSAAPDPIHDDTYVPPPTAVHTAPRGPQWRTDRPPSAQPHPLPAQPRDSTTDDAPQVYGRTPSEPAHRAPAVPFPAATSPPAALPRALAPPPAPPRVSPVSQAPPRPAPAPRASEAEPRGAGAHADRDSRDRAER